MKKTHLLIIIALLFAPTISCQLFEVFSAPADPTPTRIPQTDPTQTPTQVLLDEPDPNPTPTLSAAPGAVSDVTDTHWVGRIYDQDNQLIFEVFEVIFLPGGKLRYFKPNQWRENGTWEQNGNDIIMQWADHACDLYGILSGDTIAGAINCEVTGTRGWWVQLETP